MRRTLRLTAGAIALGLVLAVVPLSSASAASEYTPPSRWRHYMLNVAGSVLGAAMPNSWQREQVAYRYSQQGMPSSEQLNAMYGHRDMVRNVDGQLIPRVAGHGTYDDVVLRELDDQLEGRSTRSKISVPATKPANFMKNVAGLGSVVFGLPMSFGFGSGVAQLFGLDSAGAVCASTPDNASIITQFFTGVDCDAWRMNPEFTPNQDVSGALSVNVGPISLTFQGTTTMTWTTNPSNWYNHCYSGTWSNGGVVNGQYRYLIENQKLNADGSGSGVWFNREPAKHTTTNFGACGELGGWAIIAATGTGSAYTRYSPEVRVRDTTTGQYTYAEEAEADPDRTLTCTITYTDGSMDFLTSEPYKESEGSVSALTCPETDEDKTVAGIEVTENGSGQTHTLLDEPTTSPYQDFADNYPECRTGVCLLDLLYKKADNSYGSCFDLADGCPGWFEDPSKTDKYECMYGVKEVDLDECAVYAGIFQPGRVETGSPYSDPLTGIWSGGKNAPEPSKGAMGQTVQNPAGVRGCDFSGLGFDPVGWVLRPIQCGMEWAFVPRPAVVEAEAAGIKSQWEQTPPGALIGAVAGWSFAAPAGGCGGLTIPWSSILGHNVPDWNLLNACPGSPLQPAATASMIVLSISAVLGLIWSVTASFGGVSGFRGMAGGRDNLGN